VPQRPDELVEDFRRFVAALDDPDSHDVHWCRQTELVDLLPLSHVGRLEAIEDTWAALLDHIGDPAAARPGRANETLLPMPAHAYDDGAAAVVNVRFAEDQKRFGYAPVAPADVSPSWEETTAALLPAVRLLVERHNRIGQLSATAGTEHPRSAAPLARSAAERRRVTAAARERGAAAKAAIVNLEGIDEFGIDWKWARDEPLARGFTAVVRVKNEAQALPYVLPPLLRAVSRVILIDNGSTDGTPEVAQETAQQVGAGDRLAVRTYPFSVSRCGPEHLATPADSVHSLTYFYNWAFSQVETTYALKWDGDMVLTETGVDALRDAAWQTETGDFMIAMPRYPLYVADSATAYLDVSVSNREFWGWPNRRGFEHAKAFEWELMTYPEQTGKLALPDWSCIELKHLDVDEFSNWSQEDFTASRRTARKNRELKVFRAVAEHAALPHGVLRIDSPDGRDVVEYVRSVWIPREKPSLSRLHEKARRRQLLRGA
jgi:hypothetical protein